MKVETYEVEQENTEIAQLAADGESAMLIEKLGLNGQKTLMNTDTGTMLPYRLITKEENAVFSTLFPIKTRIEEYKSGPIPVRVLQVAAFVKELGRSDMKILEVWHPEDAKDDPVLVAREESWRGTIYLLARWGQALLSFDELREKAVEKLKAVCVGKLKKARAEVESELAHVEDSIRAKMADGDVYNPQFIA